jgi:hypothetical protein
MSDGAPLPFRESMDTAHGAAQFAGRQALRASSPGTDDIASGALLSEEVGPPEIPPEEIIFSERDVLGRGAFGTVYSGRCRGKRVAVSHKFACCFRCVSPRSR